MKFYGQWKPRVDEVLFRNYFEEQKTGFAIECGATDGVYHSCCRFFEEYGWKIVNIEPNKEEFSVLVKRRPKSINIRAALSNRNGKAILHKDTLAGIAKDTDSGKWIVETISCQTLFDMIQNRQIDLFCLDIEGHEPYVLKGIMDSGLTLPKIFCIEYPFCTIKKIKKILGDKYRFDGISFNNIFFSRPNTKVRNPFWGRTEEFRKENGKWVTPKNIKY